VIHPRTSIILLAAGLNLAWLIVAGLAAEDPAKEPADSKEVREDAASDTAPKPSEEPSEKPPAVEAPPAADGATSPAAEPAPTGAEPSKGKLPPVPAPADSLPNTDATTTPGLPPPDGVQVPGNPLPVASPEKLATDTATPFDLPEDQPANARDGSAQEDPDSVELPSEEFTPPDDQNAPWTFAPGGFAQQAALGFGGGGAAPSGFLLGNSGIPTTGVPVAEGIFEGFSIGANLSGIYTSNALSSPGEPIAPIQDDFIIGLGGSISYLSKASEWTFGGSYAGNYFKYVELDSLSAYNQAFGLVANYDGKKLSASMNANVSYDQGVNRFLGSQFVEQTTYNFNLNTRYRLSSKTSLQGTLSQSFFTIGDDSTSDRETFNFSLASLWRYSKLTEFGPGIRYSQISGGGQTGLSTIGPEILVNYQLGSKVSLNSRIGVQFAEYDSGAQADPFISSSIGLNYAASKLWGMNLSVSSGAQAEGSTAETFNQLNSVRLGYHRRIRKATLNLGLSYEVSTQETSDSSVNTAAVDRNFLNISGSLGMPILSNTTFASIFVQYNDQSADAQQSWNAVQTGFSLTRRF
jgi:hypothetical protein